MANFHAPKDFAASVLASPHLIGDNALVLADSSQWGSPSPTTPGVAIAKRLSDSSFVVFEVTANNTSTNTLTISQVLSGADLDLDAFDEVQDGPASTYITELQAASLTVGNLVRSGTANQVLYVDSSGNLAGSANLTFSTSAAIINKPTTIGSSSAPRSALDVRGTVTLGTPGSLHGVITSTDGVYINTDVNATGTNDGRVVIGTGRAYDTGGTVFAYFDRLGKLSLNGGTTTPGAQFQVTTSSASTKGVIVKGSATQSANLVEFQNSAGTTQSAITPLGRILVGLSSPSTYAAQLELKASAVSTTTLALLDSAGNLAIRILDDGQILTSSGTFSSSGNVVIRQTGGSGTYIDYIGGVNFRNASAGSATTASITPTLFDSKVSGSFVATTASTKGLIVKGAASQTANLVEAQDSTGAFQAAITATGNLSFNPFVTTVPSNRGVIFSNAWAIYDDGSLVIGKNSSGVYADSTALIVETGTNSSPTQDIQKWRVAGAGGTSLASVSAKGEGKFKGLATAIASKTSAYTLTASDSIITADATTAAFAVTLPGASTVPAGRQYTVKKTDASGNAVTVTRSGSDLIDSASTYALSSQNKYATVVSNGSNAWFVIANN